MDYDKETAWAYFIGTKAAHDYAVMKTIMQEIAKRDKSFQPKTHMDFGSGIGTVSWVVKEIFGQMYETFNVDQSRDMNDFSRMIINKDLILIFL